MRVHPQAPSSPVHVCLVVELLSDDLPGLMYRAQAVAGGLDQLTRQLVQALGVRALQLRPGRHKGSQENILLN